MEKGVDFFCFGAEERERDPGRKKICLIKDFGEILVQRRRRADAHSRPLFFFKCRFAFRADFIGHMRGGKIMLNAAFVKEPTLAA